MVKLWIADKSDPAQIPWELDFFCSTMLKIFVLLSLRQFSVQSRLCWKPTFNQLESTNAMPRLNYPKNIFIGSTQAVEMVIQVSSLRVCARAGFRFNLHSSSLLPMSRPEE